MEAGTDSTSHLPDGKPAEPPNVLVETARAAAYTAIVSPMLGVAQIIDQSGTHLSSGMKDKFSRVGLGELPETTFNTPAWYAQQLGSTAGMLVPYLGTRFAVGKAERALLSETAALSRTEKAATESTKQILFRPATREGALSATAGFIYGGVLTPSDEADIYKKSFYTDRLKNGAGDAANFGTIGFVNPYIGKGLDAAAKTLGNVDFIKTPIVAGIFAAVPAGAVSAEIGALKDGRFLPSGEELKQSVVSMAFVGGALGGASWMGAKSEGAFKTNARVLTDTLNITKSNDNTVDFKIAGNKSQKEQGLKQLNAYQTALDSGTRYQDLSLKAAPRIQTVGDAIFGNSSIGRSLAKFGEPISLGLLHQSDSKLSPTSQAFISSVDFLATCLPLKGTDMSKDVLPGRTSNGLTQRVWIDPRNESSLDFSVSRNGKPRELASGQPVDQNSLAAVSLGGAPDKTAVKIFGADSPIIQPLIELAAKGLNLSHLEMYIGNSDARKAMISHMVQKGATAEELNLGRLSSIEKLQKFFGPESPQMTRLFELEKEGLDIKGLGNWINKDRDNRQSTVQQLLDKGVDAKQLDAAQLNVLELLHNTFDKETIDKIVALRKGDESLKKLTPILQRLAEPGREEEVAEFKQLLNDNIDVTRLYVDTFDALGSTTFNSAERLKLLKLSPQGLFDYDIDNIRRYLDESDDSSTNHHQIFAEAIQHAEKPEDVKESNLRAIELVAQNLGFDFVKSHGNKVDYQQLSEFIGEDPAGHTALVEKLLKLNADPTTLTYDKLIALQRLNTEFGGKASDQTLTKIIELSKQGLDISGLADYVSDDPQHNSAKVEALLMTEGVTAKELGRLGYSDLSTLDATLSPETRAWVDKLEPDGVSKQRLAEFIKENTESRVQKIELLSSENAGGAELNNLMRLNLFPDDVAFKLVKESGDSLHVPSLIGQLRDWNAGRYLRDAVIERVRAGSPVTEKLVDELMSDSIARSQKSSSAKVVPRLSEPVGILEGPESRDPETPPMPHVGFASIAGDIIRQATEDVLEAIPEDKTIVLLGRDCWPLLPLLRAEGRHVTYFPWSRLQLNEPSTQQQWLKEVPPGAAVIDTGYAGSIMDAIKEVDSTVGLYLLSSDGEYPQLLKNVGHGELVGYIEHFPKLIGRSELFTRRGGAVTNKSNDSRDEEERDNSRGNRRWWIEAQNRTMLRSSGLPEWDVWRYSTYVGLTPKERLGLNTDQEAQAYMKQVQDARGKKN